MKLAALMPWGAWWGKKKGLFLGTCQPSVGDKAHGHQHCDSLCGSGWQIEFTKAALSCNITSHRGGT